MFYVGFSARFTAIDTMEGNVSNGWMRVHGVQFTPLAEVLKVNTSVHTLIYDTRHLRWNHQPPLTMTTLVKHLTLDSDINTLCVDGGILAFVNALKVNICIRKLVIYAGTSLLHDETVIPAVADMLLVNETLRELDCRLSSLNNLAIDSLSNALRQNPALQVLRLQGNRLGDMVFSSLFEALKVNDRLHNLDLSLYRLSSTDLVVLFEALQVNAGLRHLELDGCHLGTLYDFNVVRDALCANTTLYHLSLQGNNLSDSHVESIFSALKVNRTLCSLNVSVNVFGDRGAAVLVDGLTWNTTLHVLKMRRTHLTGRHIDALATLLQTNTGLFKLDLSNNPIETTNVLQLADALTVNQSLRHIDLSNTALTVASAKSLAKALCVNHTLSTLSLSKNILKGFGVTLSRALARNHGLVQLSLAQCCLSDADVVHLSQGLAQNATLHTLHLTPNFQVSVVGWYSMIERAHANASLETLTCVGLEASNRAKSLTQRNQAGKRCARQSTRETYKVLRLRHIVSRDLAQLLARYLHATQGQMCWVDH